MGPVLRAAALSAVALVLPVSASADDDLRARAERLAALRSEVSGLQATLAERQEALGAHLRALDAQRIELDVQLRREEVRLAQLGDDLAALQARAAADADLEDHVRPALRRGLAALRAQVAAGLPYRTDERLAALDDLEAQVERGDLAPSRALGRLWASFEDELRLARENALDRQVVSLPQGEVLADVVRLGTVALFFRAPDGTVGHAARTVDGTWTWVRLDDPTQVRRVQVLIDTLRKGIRTGWFELPWAFGEVPR